MAAVPQDSPPQECTAVTYYRLRNCASVSVLSSCMYSLSFYPKDPDEGNSNIFGVESDRWGGGEAGRRGTAVEAAAGEKFDMKGRADMVKRNLNTWSARNVL